MYSEKPKLQERQRSHKPGDLRTIALDVTPLCNMRCAHCYAETFVNVEPIELDVVARALEEAYQLGVFHYVLLGGEPILEPARLEAIIEMTHPEESYINVGSNGWAMTRERIAWLKRLQVDKISLSLDSGLEEEHDRIRGRGSFLRVMNAIDNVLAAGLICSISTLVTHRTVRSRGFERVCDIAREKHIRLDIQIAEPVGKWDGKCDDLITPEDAAYLKQLHLESPILPSGRRMIYRDVFCGPDDHCPAGREFLSITADGQVLPCNFLQFTLGNIRERSLREMRQMLLTSRWFDGKHPECLAGENREFIATFISPHVDKPKPLDAVQTFGLPDSGC